MSRSVFEHLTDPQSVYRELARVLRPGGRIAFLTANLRDYGTAVARLVPNRLRGSAVNAVARRLPRRGRRPRPQSTANHRADLCAS